jgi:hypothetical protein
MGNDDADQTKRLILARRARFVAAALASVTAAGTAACGKTTAQPCLEPPPATASPHPCLDVASPEPCLAHRVDPPDAGSTEPQPTVCLKVAPLPKEGGT